jgi:predicted transcriptional regulator
MPKLPKVTETELAILDVLWERGPTDVRDVVQAIYGEHNQTLHATVKSLLERLDVKGYVACDRSRFAHQFSARIDRETFVGRQLQELADSHFAGSLNPMLLTLLDRVKLGSRDRATIRKIIDKLD